MFFGSYEQDDNSENGKEYIEWQVLKKDEDKLLLISSYVLDTYRYNSQGVSITWETCSLRKWLNETFYNEAFNKDEQNRIKTTLVAPHSNPDYSVNAGNNGTRDKVFLLSIWEADNYFKTNGSRRCQATLHAISQGAKVYSQDNECEWHLRTPGNMGYKIAYVSYDGAIKSYGKSVNELKEIRPAIWIDLNGL